MHFVWFSSTFFRILKFLQIEKWGANFWGEQILWKVWIIWCPFCISILKVLRTQILRQSLDFNAFCMIQEHCSQSLDISTKSRGRLKFWREAVFQKVWIIWSSLLYFNIKSFLDAKSSTFITFQCILHVSEVFFQSIEISSK